MIKAITTKLGPQDNGRRMSLKDFEHAEVQEGYLYELGRGVVVVSDVPNLRHGRQSRYIRNLLGRYDDAHPGWIHWMGAGSECKILVDDHQSERHPDWAIYLKPPPRQDDMWRWWIPDILIEIISPGSEHRDYEEKREEYLQIGVKEYWIVDADRRQILVLQRRGAKWKERILEAGDIYETKLLPDFQLECSKVFEAADQGGSK